MSCVWILCGAFNYLFIVLLGCLGRFADWWFYGGVVGFVRFVAVFNYTCYFAACLWIWWVGCVCCLALHSWCWVDCRLGFEIAFVIGV